MVSVGKKIESMFKKFDNANWNEFCYFLQFLPFEKFFFILYS